MSSFSAKILLMYLEAGESVEKTKKYDLVLEMAVLHLEG